MTRFFPLLVCTATACMVESDDDNDDKYEPSRDQTSSGSGAPWEFTEINSALWIEDPDNNARSGDAALFLSTDSVTCADLAAVEYEWDILELIGTGSGLLYVLEYWSDRALESPWEGLWMSGYSGSVGDDLERSMASIGFHEGRWYVMSYYGGGADWLRIDAADASDISGEFWNTHWSGTFAAEHCGQWEDRDYDTGWGDYETEVDEVDSKASPSPAAPVRPAASPAVAAATAGATPAAPAASAP